MMTAAADHPHEHPHEHDHPHDETKLVETDFGRVLLSIFEEGVPPRFRVHFQDAAGQPVRPPSGAMCTVETLRGDGSRQVFVFEPREGGFLEATDELPEPHEFEATLTLTRGGRVRRYPLRFVEHAHEHDHGHEHDHPHEPDHPHPHSHATPGAQGHIHGHGGAPDRVAMVYSGVSIGAATVQMTAFQLVLDVDPAGGVSRIAQRKVLSRRPAVPTPYLDDGSLDIGALGFALLELGATAPVIGDQIHGRVAVLSGQAVEESAAYWIGRAFLDIDYMPYVCLRAGPHLGAVLAAYGGDAVARSVGPHGEDRVVLNVDLGASTAKLALCRGGRVLETAAIAVGTRMVRLGPEGRIVELRPLAARVGDTLGLRLEVGAGLGEREQRALADELAECLFNLIERRRLEPLTQALMLTDPLHSPERITSISFTGGGAEYVFESQEASFGDLGPALGRAVRLRLNRLGISVHEPEHILRATLLGGAQFGVADVHAAPRFLEPEAFAAARARDAELIGAASAAAASGPVGSAP